MIRGRIERQAALGDAGRLRLIPQSLQKSRIDEMNPGGRLHGLGHVKLSAILHKIRIADSGLRVQIVKQYLRLGPVEVSILFDSPGDPRWVPVGVVIPRTR